MLTSLADLDEVSQFETIVVVNGTTDPNTSHVAAEISSKFPEISVIESETNRGVAGGYNLARMSASGEFLVLAHDDVEVRAGWLDALVDSARRHPDAGAIGSRVLHSDGRLRTAGMILWSDATTSPPWTAPPEDSEFSDDRIVDYCASCSLLVRADSWDATGGMNEALFPAYFIDVDLAMAIRRTGRCVMYCPDSVVIHYDDDDGRRRRTFLGARNRQRFIDTWGPDLSEFLPNTAPVSQALLRPSEHHLLGVGTMRSMPTARLSGPLPDENYRDLEARTNAEYLDFLEDALTFYEARVRDLEAALTQAKL